MPSFQPYEDLPPIVDEESFGNIPFRTNTPYMATNSSWAALDPTLGQNRYVHDYSMYPPAKNLQTMQDHLVELENSANGFGPLAPLQIPGQQFPRLDVHSPWSEPHRNVRYLSPNGYLGGSLSSSNSSPSERAFSPDVARHYATPSVYSYFNGNSYHSPAADISYMGNGSTLSQPTHFVGGLASPSPSHSSAACNPRALQYTPDTSMEDDHLDEDTIRVKMTGPEEIVSLPDITSPADSGLGQSVDDELSEYAPESDNDTEYMPARAARKQSMNPRRPFMRGPRRQKSLQTPTTIDPKNRVSKPASRKKPDARVHKNGLTKAEREAAKMFTCTFSHYGCDAKFASKNEWKRHVSSQHLQLGFYRCDVGSCNPDLHPHHGSSRTYNDFNRKDLFTQHHRRMHTPWGNPKEGSKRQWDEFEEGLEAIRKRCWRVRREPPTRSGCGFCGRVFEEDDGLSNNNGVVVNVKGSKDNKGHHVHHNSWEERMEHVGKHIEQADWDLAAEREDEDLTAWAIREGIVRDHVELGVWLVGMEPGEGRLGGGEARRRSRRRMTADQDVVVAGGEEDEEEDDEEEDAQGEDE